MFPIPDSVDSGQNGTRMRPARGRSRKPRSRPESPASTSNSHSPLRHSQSLRTNCGSRILRPWQIHNLEPLSCVSPGRALPGSTRPPLPWDSEIRERTASCGARSPRCSAKPLGLSSPPVLRLGVSPTQPAGLRSKAGGDLSPRPIAPCQASNPLVSGSQAIPLVAASRRSSRRGTALFQPASRRQGRPASPVR